jgi:hypothetical protein
MNHTSEGDVPSTPLWMYYVHAVLKHFFDQDGDLAELLVRSRILQDIPESGEARISRSSFPICEVIPW